MFCAVNKQKRTSVGEVVVSVLLSSPVFTGKTLIKSSSPKTSPCRLPYCPSVTFSSSSFQTFSLSLSLSIDRLCLSLLIRSIRARFSTFSYSFASVKKESRRFHGWSIREHETFASINDTELSSRFLPSRNNWFLLGRFRIVLGLDSEVRGMVPRVVRVKRWLIGKTRTNVRAESKFGQNLNDIVVEYLIIWVWRSG